MMGGRHAGSSGRHGPAEGEARGLHVRVYLSVGGSQEGDRTDTSL